MWTSFSPFLVSVQIKCLWICREHKQKSIKSEVSVQCYTYPLEQAARLASPSKRHCFFSAAAEITFIFNSTRSPPPSHLLSPTLPPLLPPLQPSPQLSFPFSAKLNEYVVCCAESYYTSELAIGIDIDIVLDYLSDWLSSLLIDWLIW